MVLPVCPRLVRVARIAGFVGYFTDDVFLAVIEWYALWHFLPVYLLL